MVTPFLIPINPEPLGEGWRFSGGYMTKEQFHDATCYLRENKFDLTAEVNRILKTRRLLKVGSRQCRAWRKHGHPRS